MPPGLHSRRHRSHPVCTALRGLACVGVAFALFAIVAILLGLVSDRGVAAMKAFHLTFPVLVMVPLFSGGGLWLLAEYLDYHTWLEIQRQRACRPPDDERWGL